MPEESTQPISYKCPNCRVSLESPAEFGGREDVCPRSRRELYAEEGLSGSFPDRYVHSVDVSYRLRFMTQAGFTRTHIGWVRVAKIDGVWLPFIADVDGVSDSEVFPGVKQIWLDELRLKKAEAGKVSATVTLAKAKLEADYTGLRTANTRLHWAHGLIREGIRHEIVPH